jgi:DNA polymerase IIIc chi subunit
VYWCQMSQHSANTEALFTARDEAEVSRQPLERTQRYFFEGDADRDELDLSSLRYDPNKEYAPSVSSANLSSEYSSVDGVGLDWRIEGARMLIPCLERMRRKVAMRSALQLWQRESAELSAHELAKEAASAERSVTLYKLLKTRKRSAQRVIWQAWRKALAQEQLSKAAAKLCRAVLSARRKAQLRQRWLRWCTAVANTRAVAQAVSAATSALAAKLRQCELQLLQSQRRGSAERSRVLLLAKAMAAWQQHVAAKKQLQQWRCITEELLQRGEPHVP